MAYEPEIHHRRSIRLQGYDYSQVGAYFVTLCSDHRKCLFGDILGEEMRINDLGRIVQIAWNELPDHYPGVALDAFVVMPNHVHGIIVIGSDTVGAIHESPLPTRRGMLLPKIIGRLKMISAKNINLLRSTPGVPVWQRNYYERVIRNEDELNAARQYITDNPARWAEDRNHPGNIDYPTPQMLDCP